MSGDRVKDTSQGLLYLFISGVGSNFSGGEGSNFCNGKKYGYQQLDKSSLLNRLENRGVLALEPPPPYATVHVRL